MKRENAKGAKIVCLCDVRTPFERAAEVFGPQKGADPATVKKLTKRLNDFAQTLPRDPRGKPMTGCAGGFASSWAPAASMTSPATTVAACSFHSRARKSSRFPMAGPRAY